MEWGKQMEKHQENAKFALYQNSNYNFERSERKTLILEIDLTTSENTFSVNLIEPLIVDKLSDIYLDSFTTHYVKTCDSVVDMGFILDIDQFNIQNNSTNKNLFNKIFIPNEDTAGTSTIVHKSKKLNYVCQINPCKLYEITGSITDCQLHSTGAAGFILGSSTGRFIAEFVIVSRD